MSRNSTEDLGFYPYYFMEPEFLEDGDNDEGDGQDAERPSEQIAYQLNHSAHALRRLRREVVEALAKSKPKHKKKYRKKGKVYTADVTPVWPLTQEAVNRKFISSTLPNLSGKNNYKHILPGLQRVKTSNGGRHLDEQKVIDFFKLIVRQANDARRES